MRRNEMRCIAVEHITSDEWDEVYSVMPPGGVGQFSDYHPIESLRDFASELCRMIKRGSSGCVQFMVISKA